eukprot:NODE_544_length_6876_cov_0.251439.p5 type:complete len:117 gc:universal NODE_544_length_6876_cov_0.251439:1780-1430(-)
MELAAILDDVTVLYKRLSNNKAKISSGVCPQCHRQFCDSSTALRHLKHVHARPVPCKYCSKLLKIIGRPEVIKNHYIRCHKFLSTIVQGSDVKICAAEEAKKDYEKVKVGYKKLLS